MQRPEIGSVWGVPDKPETWWHVIHVWPPTESIKYRTFQSGGRRAKGAEWASWFDRVGAIDITACVRHGVHQVRMEKAAKTGGEG